MKTDREMLTKLIKEWSITPLPSDCISGDAMAAHLADYLISKGVTIPVRCSECMWYITKGCSEGFGLCKKNNRGESDESFCPYGERKEE